MSSAPIHDPKIGLRIRRLRLERRLSRPALGRRLGISPRQVERYEDGRDGLSMDALERIAGCFEVTLDYFFEGGRVPFAHEQDAASEIAVLLSRIDEPLKRAIVEVLRELASQEPPSDTRTH